MKNEKAQKLIAAIIKEVEKENFDVKKVSEQITELREIARELQDPLVLKTLRFIKEKLADGSKFELEIESEDEEEEVEIPENQLLYLFQLLLDSDNKYNREEIKQYRAALQSELY
jgi:hypothetical protein